MSGSQALVGRTYFVRTFGCQMNLHDSERVSGLLGSCGCIEVDSLDTADIVVFMTCCVREKADTHLYGQVSSLVSAPQPPSGHRLVAVGGCIAQRDGDHIRSHIANVDVVFGTKAIGTLPQLLEAALDSSGELISDTREDDERGFSSDLPSHREQSWHAWVPIMTGCNNFCTYCIVPHVRGRERDREFDDIVREVERLKADGVREVCLLGQNVNSFGRQRYGSPRFAELLRAVGETGIERIRFTSSHPKDLSDETIAAMAETDAVMPQLHLAVQSGSNRVLKAMNRRYTREDFLSLADRIKTAMPGIAFSTDIIVGFPGETEQDFEETLSLVREVEFSSAFTFIYSPREGTPAARYEQTDSHEVIQERFERLTHLVSELAHKANQVELGSTVEALVEGTSKRNSQVLVGHSRKNQTVLFDIPDRAEASDFVGKLADVHVDEAKTWYLRGTLRCEVH